MASSCQPQLWVPCWRWLRRELRGTGRASGESVTVLSRMWRAHAERLLPGTLVCAVIALAATYLSEHYGGPQLLYALLIGLAFHFLIHSPSILPGVAFCGRTVLRLGVALLGARITMTQITALGWTTGVLLMVAVGSTVLFGLGVAKWLKRPTDEGLLSGAAVAICGASAALAVASVLPQTKANERFTLLTVVGVTVLSTLAMVVYPFVLKLAGVSDVLAGVFLGGTIHDVAQVVAAGTMLGPATGDVATVIKLFRVMLLMPVVILIALAYRHHTPGRNGIHFDVNSELPTERGRVPLVPNFLLAFVVLVLLASVGVIDKELAQLASSGSRWMLVTAIAAAGIKTSFEDLMKLGWQPVLMIVAETVFIAAMVLIGLHFV